MGYIYVIDVICIAGPSGLIMAFYANGNIASILCPSANVFIAQL
jgi:hypothetical protein